MESNSTVETLVKPRVSMAQVPAKEQALCAVSKSAAVQWSQSALVLLWTTSAEFTSLTDTYALQLNQRNDEGNSRPELTNRLKELDKLINEGIEYVKGYVEDEVKKENAPAYFSQFGIEKVSKSYKLPYNRNSRLIALDTLLKGIAARNYGKRNYGTAYWQPIVDEYRSKLSQASTTDGKVAGYVGAKNNTKKQVKKTLNALVGLLKANYPDTYASELRKWGFQKEKY